MDERTRRDERIDSYQQRANQAGEEERDELSERRDQTHQRPALTRREREDRWPIG